MSKKKITHKTPGRKPLGDLARKKRVQALLSTTERDRFERAMDEIRARPGWERTTESEIARKGLIDYMAALGYRIED